MMTRKAWDDVVIQTTSDNEPKENDSNVLVGSNIENICNFHEHAYSSTDLTS